MTGKVVENVISACVFLREKRFESESAQNIALRLITDERSAEMLKYMDKNPEADDYELTIEAERIQQQFPRPRRNRTKQKQIQPNLLLLLARSNERAWARAEVHP